MGDGDYPAEAGDGPDRPDVLALVARAVGRDAAAFGALYERVVAPGLPVPVLPDRRPPTAEDLTEDVFLKAWQAIGHFGWHGRPFVAWLYRLAGRAGWPEDPARDRVGPAVHVGCPARARRCPHRRRWNPGPAWSAAARSVRLPAHVDGCGGLHAHRYDDASRPAQRDAATRNAATHTSAVAAAIDAEQQTRGPQRQTCPLAMGHPTHQSARAPGRPLPPSSRQW
jgi:hypothetical protein